MLQQVLKINGIKGKYGTCFHCFGVQQLCKVGKDGEIAPVVVK